MTTPRCLKCDLIETIDTPPSSKASTDTSAPPPPAPRPHGGRGANHVPDIPGLIGRVGECGRQEAIAGPYLKSLSPKERFEIVNEQASKLVAVQEKVDKYMEYLEDFVEEDDTFKGRMLHDPEV